MSLKLIQSITLASPGSFSFTVPGGYKDLLILALLQGSSADVLGMRLNGDSGNNYIYSLMGGNFSGVYNSAVPRDTYAHVGTTATQGGGAICCVEISIQNYLSTVFNKSFRSAGTDNSGNKPFHAVGAWQPVTPAAITSISLFGSSFNIYTGSTASLYAMK